jgi:hypothetical protein
MRKVFLGLICVIAIVLASAGLIHLQSAPASAQEAVQPSIVEANLATEKGGIPGMPPIDWGFMTTEFDLTNLKKETIQISGPLW